MFAAPSENCSEFEERIGNDEEGHSGLQEMVICRTEKGVNRKLGG
jgi:hypothetical protein